MKKCCLWYLLIMLLCFGVFVGLAEEAVRYTSGDYKYILLEDGTAEIVDYTGSETELTVPALLDDHPVTGIGERAFAEYIELKAVVLPDGLLRIGKEAFSGCSALVEMVLPDSVTILDDKAFANCTELRSINFPNRVSVGNLVLVSCHSDLVVTIDNRFDQSVIDSENPEEREKLLMKEASKNDRWCQKMERWCDKNMIQYVYPEQVTE